MRIYVASSWRNARQPEVVQALRDADHKVYDFRSPAPGDHGFDWSEIDSAWWRWNAGQFRDALSHELAHKGFQSDFAAMQWAEACVLVLPSGRSAHLEAGWFAGRHKPVVVLLADGCEPELTYLLADARCVDMAEVLEALAAREAAPLVEGTRMRNMSFSMTTPQLLAGTKDVTRRLGWLFLKAGDRVCAVEKAQGLRKGEKVKRLAVIQVVSTRRESLLMITPSDVMREGFPDMTVGAFVQIFCKAMRCEPGTVITRIHFRVERYADGQRWQ